MVAPANWGHGGASEVPLAGQTQKRGQRSAGMVQGPLGTVENATMGCALTRTAPVYNPGERGARWFDKGGEFGHLSKPSVI